MQYYSRLKIKVKSPKVWDKFKDTDDANFDLAKLSSTNKTSYSIDCSYLENELFGTVDALSLTLENDGIIVSDTRNINVDSYTYCVYYLGEKIHDAYFDYDDKRCNLFDETNIEDIVGWLEYGKFSVTKKEKELLSELGIEVVDNHFVTFNYEVSIPKIIKVRETGTGNRIQNIEDLTKNTKLKLIHSKDDNDPLRLELMSDVGSIGFLPSDVCEQITPLIINKKMNYKVTIVDLVKLSERNAYAKSPIVAVNIELIK